MQIFKMNIMREIINVFEEASSSYDDWYHKPKGVYAFHSELMGLKALLPPSGVGIDIGSGTGIFAEHLTTDERCVICMDPSPGMLDKVKKRGLPAIRATVEALPLRYGRLQFAYMVTVMEFLRNPLRALCSIGEILKEDAPLVTLLINRESPWGEQYSKLAEKGDPIFSHARLFTLNEASCILKKSGFHVEESIGTLTASPDEPKEEYKLVPIKRGVGVILIKAKQFKRSARSNDSA